MHKSDWCFAEATMHHFLQCSCFGEKNSINFSLWFHAINYDGSLFCGSGMMHISYTRINAYRVSILPRFISIESLLKNLNKSWWKKDFSIRTKCVQSDGYFPRFHSTERVSFHKIIEKTENYLMSDLLCSNERLLNHNITGFDLLFYPIVIVHECEKLGYCLKI